MLTLPFSETTKGLSPLFLAFVGGEGAEEPERCTH
ncbi:hypothetical protein F8B43_3996 [Methylorubrum populi]|uniref:Uncharacterized protein n=1 Tax=Methylorubrum populi TaxID=223967 RepID=A0A833N2B3_9HYPH|nr:hypothetical protein F8B43_3996 [Methylorubrum populi]